MTWIERTYHRRRRQRALGRLTPLEFETIPECQSESQQSRQRRLVIGHNKAWASAADVRRTFLRELLTRKTAPQGTTPFVAAMLANHSHLLHHYEANRLAADPLLGQEPGPYGPSDALAQLIEQADDRRAQGTRPARPDNRPPQTTVPLEGNIAAEIELTYTTSGKQVVRFPVLVNRRRKDPRDRGVE